MRIPRIIILIVFIVGTVSCPAQRLDSHGRKMVKSLHLQYYGWENKVDKDIRIIYQYDNNDNLASVTGVFGKDRIWLKRKGNRISSNFYDFEMNDSGFITKKVEKFTIMKDSSKQVTWYEYMTDENGDTHLKRINRQQFVKKYRTNVWDSSESIYHTTFEYWDGECYWDKSHSSYSQKRQRWEYLGNDETRYKENMYTDIKNDTNVYLNLFFSMQCWSICLCFHEFELSTDWFGLKSEHILKGIRKIPIMTKLDSKGNIVEMTTKKTNGTLYKKMWIEYVK